MLNAEQRRVGVVTDSRFLLVLAIALGSLVCVGQLGAQLQPCDGHSADADKQPAPDAATPAKTPAKTDSAAKGPKWACDASSIDLKPVWASKPLKATWTVRNSGDADLTINIKRG